jgi:hypothetical protein
MQLSRINEDYLVSQIEVSREADSHRAHKARIEQFDLLYRGDLSAMFPEETALPKEPLVENKIKNATHDLARLSSEAKGAHVFMRDGESSEALKRGTVRSAIADTIWNMARGARIERKMYIDLITAGYAAISVYYNDSSDYPIMMRLNPRFCYPDVHNGQLQSMLYVETMKERQAAMIWPDAGLSHKASSMREVYIVQYFDKDEAVQAVAGIGKGGKAETAHITQRWEHKLGCVPVAWVALDSADDTFHGLFDQLGGPLMIRNKIIRLLTDYLESMTHAPMEAKGVTNATAEPGPLLVYQHDETAPESFIRRVAPAAPAGGVFGLLQYMDSQESAEAIQPPARVGVVKQSIASGSFVDSTQGTLSSVIFELQEVMADLRYQANCVAFKIDARYLNREKPLYRAVGNKNTYTPKEDMGDFHYHTIQYGASAGLNRAEAGVRVLQDMGAGLISKEMARTQLDYVDDVTIEQNRIDREQLSNVFFQRFSADPNTPMSIIANAIIEMSKGKSLIKVIEKIAPELIALEQQKIASEAGAPQGAAGSPEEGVDPVQEQMALESGMTQDVDFAPPPMQQQIVRGGFPS